jgi:hypothetical protein
MGLFDLKKRLLSNASLSDLHKIKTGRSRGCWGGRGLSGVATLPQWTR